ncbi:phage tail protein [Paraburkholderia sp. J8-2]|uniref:phage tail protein n=1 Tax=Paraburkholderia sp. J8-2 TaxID=2805440 RepID=UPI002AB7399E|nr:phage tail protein [Paraburkholderia sp. J8-2]
MSDILGPCFAGLDATATPFRGRAAGAVAIRGAKGDSSSASATEAPDSLHSTATAKVLDIISEGPIVGLVNGLASVYLDGTPILNADGSANFQNYSVDTRLGTVDQDFIPSIPSVENEIAIALALTSDAPWVHELTNTQLTAARIRFGVPALSQTDKSNGNINGYRVEYAIDLATDGGAYAQVVSAAFDGKTTSLYERSHRIELPKAESGWLVRVRRVTPNAHDSYIQDTINIEAITEVIDRKLRYPNTALVAMSFDATSFSSVPTRGYLVRGRIVMVPSNYDPDTRAYAGVWDGTFKLAWTNNPAWVFYDLALNKRYGGGRYIDGSALDKWSLYAIAQWCDEMVPDGKGGQEPRFTCNAVIQSQADAFKVLQDLAGVFRGNTYWGAGSVVATADMPSDPVHVYTQANVVGGKFNYAGSERKSRYTFAQVAWNDPQNQYKSAVEPVQDDEAIARYGVIKASITAFGTSSQGQAHRLGLWTIQTSKLNTNTVTFQVGLDGTLCAPGEVFAVADAKKAGRRMGGRIRSMDGATVIVDKAPTVKTGDVLTVIMPDGVAQKRTVDSASGSTIRVTQAYDANSAKGAVWMLESDDLVAQLFTAVSVEESDDNGQICYTINGVQYEPGKFDLIDNGVKIAQRPVTVIPPKAQPGPASVTISEYQVIDQGTAKNVMTISWAKADSAIAYLVQWRKDGGNWVTAGTVSALSVDVPGIYTGTYEARVSAINALGTTSLATVSDPTALLGKTGAPPTVATLTASLDQLFDIEIDWGFPADGTANDTQRTDLYYSRTPNVADAVLLGSYAYPTSKAVLMGLAAGQSFWFWAQLVDTTGNVGAMYPGPNDALVNGQSSSDASPILDLIAGKVNKDALSQDLVSSIDAVSNIQDALNEIPNLDLAGIASLTGKVDALSVAQGTETAEREAADANLAQDIKTLTSQLQIQYMGDDATPFGDATLNAGVYSEAEARTDSDSALSDDIRAVAASVSTELETVSAMVQDEISARADFESAYAQKFIDLESNVNDTVAAQLQQEAETLATQTAAMAQQISDLQAQVGNDIQAEIQQEATARADAVSALSDQVTALQAQVGNDIQAQIAEEATARADADGALGQRIDTLTAKTADDIAAAIQTQATAQAATDAATAEEISNLTTQAGNNTSAIQTVQQSYADLTGKVNATYTVKIQTTAGGVPYAAGFSLGVDGASGVSQFVVSASSFVLLDPSTGNKTSPFSITNGQTFINNAFINLASINAAIISGQLQSKVNGANGRPLFVLNMDTGDIEINGANSGSGWMQLTSGVLQAYDSNGVLRVRAGIW